VSFVIELDPAGDVPAGQQIMDQVRLAVAAGRLRPGERLEPVRHLAERLNLNPSTVARAYHALEREGVIQTNRRGGSVIAAGADAENLRDLRSGRLWSTVERSVVEALAHGYTVEEVEAAFDLQLAAWRERRRASASGLARRQAPAARLQQFAGSHDVALEALWAQARRFDPPLTFRALYVGSLDGLLALLHGEVALAGAHILDEGTGEYNIPILQRLFLGKAMCVVALAEREQGLIVRHGNPLGVRTFADLAQPGLRFVNRQPGSGTRTLLDYHLRRLDIPESRVSGYDMVAPTHLALAASIADGHADAGLGLVAAARAYGLDFLPVARERYDLVLHADDRRRAPLDALLALLETAEFRAVVAGLGGYDIRDMGRETCI
jgi:molybdate-binding protein/DNA-binding transcriptional regulator YhcF (GntR family)